MRFDSYHPAILLLYFGAAFVCMARFNHPAFLALSFLVLFAWSASLHGRRGLVRNGCLVPLIALYAAWYAYYHHFGVTPVGRNFTGNRITLEALAAGAARGTAAASAVMLFARMCTIVSADQVIYLFGRISPRLSLFLSILLRMVPRVGWRAGRINRSRRGIGMGPGQGNLPERVRRTGSFLSILLTWTMEDFLESTVSMKCRGYSLRGRSAFSIYRFDNRDRGVVLLLCGLLTLIVQADAFDQTRISYAPQLIWNRITPMSAVFYTAYGLFLALPMILTAVGSIRMRGKDRIDRSDTTDRIRPIGYDR